MRAPDRRTFPLTRDQLQVLYSHSCVSIDYTIQSIRAQIAESGPTRDDYIKRYGFKTGSEAWASDRQALALFIAERLRLSHG